jgi:hypothetical protein
MNMAAKKSVIIALVIIAVVIIVGAMLSGSSSKPNIDSTGAIDANFATQIEDNLNVLNSYENQKISAVSSSLITLENGKQIELEASDQTANGCQVGDKVVDYDETKNSFLCTDTNNGTRSSYFRPRYGGSSGFLVGYLAAKAFTRNNGINFNQATNSYTAPNGAQFTYVNPTNNNPTNPNKETSSFKMNPSTSTGSADGSSGSGTKKAGSGGITSGKGSAGGVTGGG